MDIRVKKSDKTDEDFYPDKLLSSLKKCGVDQQCAQDILEKVATHVDDETTSGEIFRKARKFLRKKSAIHYTNYGLGQALLRLGPDGYAFEQFYASLLRKQGYNTLTNQTLQGRCITHEVDIIATKDNKTIYVECKFHNHRGHKNDVKIPLYVKARALDLKENPTNRFDEFWLVSNTKFSQDAINYSTCTGLNILGQNFPYNKGIIDLIQQYRHYPITCLNGLKGFHIIELQRKGIFLVKELVDDPSKLNFLGLTLRQKKSIDRELSRLSILFNGQQH